MVRAEESITVILGRKVNETLDKYIISMLGEKDVQNLQISLKNLENKIIREIM
jgi:hypothetical protein